jgi:vitamin B12 transporter
VLSGSIKKIRSNDRGNHDLAHGAAFVIATHKLPKNIFINESLRIDWDQSYGWVIIPQVNASWVKGNLTTRASIGKGVRDADFTERYNNYNKSLGYIWQHWQPLFTNRKILELRTRCRL